MSLRSILTPLVLAIPASLVAGVPLVELKTSSETYQGRVVAKDDGRAILLDREGIMRQVPLADVTAFGVLDPTFRPYSAVDLRDRLRRIVGHGAEVTATPRYVVAGRPAAARNVAEALEEVHNGYRWFCSTRNLRLTNPEFPLVAIVMPDRASFDAYCRADGVPPGGGLRGYYRETTNRFVCYEENPISGGALPPAVQDTLVHEAIHQLAFNTGLHVRLGSDPLWVCEGFATALEPEGMRRPLRSDTRPLDRANPERLERYLRIADQPGRPTPEELVASDDPFDRTALDAYATAWAMTFYLLETRPADYSRYLRTLAAKSPLAESSSQQRLAEFRGEFGSDLTQFEAAMTRYLKRVAAGEGR